MSYSRGEVMKIILKVLLAGVVVGSVLLAPGLGPVIKMFSPKSKKDYRKYSRSLRVLEKQKLVSISYKGKDIIVKITDKGKRRVLQYNFEEMSLKKPKRWDGSWRIIIFDIPNTKKSQRDTFRMKLKELGFFMIQKSTFAIPYPVKNEVDFLGEFLGIRKYIICILAHKIEGAKSLREKYKLP